MQPSYAGHSNWTVEADFEFLNSAESHPFFRAFYVPGLSRKFTKYHRYLLLRRVSPRRLVPSEDIVILIVFDANKTEVIFLLAIVISKICLAQ